MAEGTDVLISVVIHICLNPEIFWLQKTRLEIE